MVVLQVVLVASFLVGLVVSFLVQILPATGLAFQYFNLVEVKEHVGLAQRVEGLQPEGVRSAEEPDAGPPDLPYSN